MFVVYWEANREREKSWSRMLLKGIPVGLLFGVPICILVYTGRFWYKRADMVANTWLDPFVLIVAVLLIIIFTAVFYRRHQWDLKEQHYQQLKLREQHNDERQEKQAAN